MLLRRFIRKWHSEPNSVQRRDAEGWSLRIFSGQGLSAHTAPLAAILYFMSGEAELTLGAEKKNVCAGAFVHMPPQTPHGILAKTPVAMLLLMLKQIRQEKSS